MFVWAPLPAQAAHLGSVRFASELLERARVAVSPGVGFGPGGEGFVRFALIEKDDHYGGAAANTGTLPSKTLRETALILSGLRQRQIFWLKFGLEGNVRIQDFLSH